LLNKLRKKFLSMLTNIGLSKPEALAEIDILFEHCFGLTKKDIILEKNINIDEKHLEQFNNLLNKRVNEKIPVQYLTNKACFMGYDFYVISDVLIPRPETELLVEAVLDLIENNFANEKEIKIIDIGTGSGCIACSLVLKSQREIKMIASDISEKALEIARFNAKKLGISGKIIFKNDDILTKNNQKMHIFVSNPPYIPLKNASSLQDEVRLHEPKSALFAPDEDGIDVYRQIICQMPSHACPNAFLAVEIGINQKEPLEELLRENNFSLIKVINDYQNIPRIIVAGL
jgi:release factor glutamine methyltransferase